MSRKMLLKLSDEELLEVCQPTKCVDCGVTLHESTTGMRPVKGGFACSDCYYVGLGAGIEAHPIGLPRMHRAR